MVDFLKQKQDEIERIIEYSQGYDFHIDCKEIIERWYDNKKRFINCFGGEETQYRTREPIKIELSASKKEEIFNEFINRINHRYYHENKDFSSFVLMNGTKGFFSNEVIETMVGYPATEGMRLSKSFKFFLYDEDEVRWVQDYYSRCIQKNKIEGYLYLSVDPVDYLTLSENNANWRSCHALDGEYRAGNLSYMVDNTTVVAYLATDEKERLNNLPKNIPWYNKKWRMLVNIHEMNNIIYFGRQYPFDDEQLIDNVRRCFNRLYDNIFCYHAKIGFRDILIEGVEGFENPYRERLSENHLYVLGKTISTKEVIEEPEYTLNFNDLIYSSVYAPWAALGRDADFTSNSIEDIKKVLTMTIGGTILCPYCKEKYITESDTFICERCRESLGLIEHEEEDY